MNCDAAFQIGKTHRVCEDYAVAGVCGSRAYAILSDGCSSSPDTDIGARLLVKSAQRLVAEAPIDWMAYARNAVSHAADCAARLDLPPTCLDATLLTITATEDTFKVSCFGDGVVVLGRHDWRLEVFAVTYAASYPRYPSYELDASRAARWTAQASNQKKIQQWTLGPDRMEHESIEPSDRAVEVWSGHTADYRFAAVLSDGVQSFLEAIETETSRTARPVTLPEVLPRLLAFKGFAGAFVQRRVQAFAKECRTRAWSHGDDLSLGCVWLGEIPHPGPLLPKGEGEDQDVGAPLAAPS